MAEAAVSDNGRTLLPNFVELPSTISDNGTEMKWPLIIGDTKTIGRIRREKNRPNWPGSNFVLLPQIQENFT